MRGRTVLVLLILVVALVAFIELYEHELPSSEERAALDKLVMGTDVRSATAIDLTWQDKHVRLERQPNGANGQRQERNASMFAWRLVEPLAATADADLVASLLESLSTLEKKRTLEGSTPEELGLSPPRLTVTLTAGERELEMLVGSRVPAGKSMVVCLANDGDALVVDDSLWPDLTREPGDWRSRRVFDLEPERIDRVALHRGDQGLVLSRQGPDFWLESPVVDRADAERVESFLASMSSMRVGAFADEWSVPVANLGLDPPQGTVEVTTVDDGDLLRLAWGSAAPGPESQRYASSGGQIFSTETDLQKYFEMPVAEWQSLALTSMQSFEIDGLDVEQPGQDFMGLVRDGANWMRGEDEISFTAVSELLHSITGARAEALLPESGGQEPDSSPPRLILGMILKGADRQQEVSVQAIAEEQVSAVVSGREVVLLLGKDEFTEILAKVVQVRAADSVKTEVDEQLLPDSSGLSSDQQR